MDKRLLDFDPTSGLETWFHYDEHTDTTTIEEKANLHPLHSTNYENRKDDDLTKQGIKKGMWMYARIHPLEQTKFLRKYGFSVFEKGREKEVLKILNTDDDFKLCKATRGTHV